jgi:hypothetical protein
MNWMRLPDKPEKNDDTFWKIDEGVEKLFKRIARIEENMLSLASRCEKIERLYSNCVNNKTTADYIHKRISNIEEKFQLKVFHHEKGSRAPISKIEEK